MPEEFVVYLHTREAVGKIGTSVDLWRICIQRMRPTVDESLNSGHCESVVTRLVLISCVSDHALAWFKIHPCFASGVLSRLFAALRSTHVIHVRLTRTVTGIDYARDRLALDISI